VATPFRRSFNALGLRRRSQLLRNGVPDGHPGRLLHPGPAVEEKDSLDDLLCILHLLERDLPEPLGEELLTPVLAHLRVSQVLVDRAQLLAEEIVQPLDHHLVPLDDRNPLLARERDGR